MNTERFPQLVQQIYNIVSEFEKMFPGRHFTPDGHLVGSLGECLAAYYYDLQLLPASTEGYDATKNNKKIEIKTTQGKAVAFRSEPKHLLVLKINRDGSFDEIYNGLGTRVWAQIKHKKIPKNGQHQVSLNKLGALMKDVAEIEKIKRIKP